MKKSFSVLLLAVFLILCYSTLSSPAGAYDSLNVPDGVSGARLASVNFNQMSNGSYAVEVAKNVGGTALPSVSDCVPGTVVKITIAPNSGYEPMSICVISAFGDAIEIIAEDGQYSFVMPEVPVIIDVTFQLLRT